MKERLKGVGGVCRLGVCAAYTSVLISNNIKFDLLDYQPEKHKVAINELKKGYRIDWSFDLAVR